MDIKELNSILAELDQAMNTLEENYIESEGECTFATEQMEEQISTLKELLSTDGIDLLGGWLKAKEDKKKALKAERDYISRQMSAIDECIDYIKGKVNQVLVATGQEKVKGNRGYSFTATTSVTTEVDKETLKILYADKIEEAIRAAHVPAYVGVSLTASSKKAAEVGVVEGDEMIFLTLERPSVRFTKPRAKED